MGNGFAANIKNLFLITGKCIGVVTSPTGAAIQDMLNILSRRFSGFHLILNPVKVQGEGAQRKLPKPLSNLTDTIL